MLGRIVELRDLRSQICRGEAAAYDTVRKIGQALRGSGATFGFERLSAAAGLVETSTDAAVLRRLEGLLSILGELTREERDGRALGPDWLAHAVELDDSDAPLPDSDVAAAWGEVTRRSGLEPSEISGRVADYLSIAVADLGARGRAALRLVPEALVIARRVVPIDENSATITLASSDPTDLETEVEVQRLTGRTPVFAVAPPEMVEALIDELYTGSSGRVADDKSTAPSELADTGSAASSGSATLEAPPLESPVKAVEPAVRRAEPPVPEGGGPPDASAEPHPQDARVLLVDDDASARLLVRAVLEKKGWDVVEAEDGFDALETMRRERSIGLAIVDLNMPRMDGLELIWELRDEQAWADLPVIVVTGEEDERLEMQLLEEGADDYVRKPVDPRLFLARVESTLRRTSV